MFKNITTLAINGDMPDREAMLEAMEHFRFAEPSAQTACAFGWVAPRPKDDTGPLLEVVAGYWHVALQVQTRKVPPAAIEREVNRMAAEMEEEFGRAPGKKQRRELKDQALMELLPRAFPRLKIVRAIIDPKAMLVYVDAGRLAAADNILTALANCAPMMNLHPLATETAPGDGMASWLEDGTLDARIVVDSEGKLEGNTEQKQAISFTGRDMSGDDVVEYLEQGLTVAHLGLTFDDRVSAVLTSQGSLRKVELLTIKPEASADAWEGQCALFAAEISAMVAALTEELGGAQKLPIEAAARAPEPAEA